VVEQSRELDQAVSALTTELLKLSPLDGEAVEPLSITIRNALSRLALAIVAQSNQTQEVHHEEAMPVPANV
jgi:hypothetical protein